MRIKKILLLSFWFLVISFRVIDQGGAQPKPGTHAPIITHAFAVDKGYYGSIWRIYIEAEDPNGDMLKIASVVEQPGYGTYPTDWIYLKSHHTNTNFRLPLIRGISRDWGIFISTSMSRR